MNYKEDIMQIAEQLIRNCCSSEYSREILEIIGDDIYEDVALCSGIKDEDVYTDDDIRFAIGRAILNLIEK